jgi:hypothetical protein
VVDKEVEDYDVDILAYKNGKPSIGMKRRLRLVIRLTELMTTSLIQFLSWVEKRSTILGARMDFTMLLYVQRLKPYVLAHSEEIFKEDFREVRKINTGHRNGLDAFYRVPKDLL